MKKILIDMQEVEVDSFFEETAEYYGITYVVIEEDFIDDFDGGIMWDYLKWKAFIR